VAIGCIVITPLEDYPEKSAGQGGSHGGTGGSAGQVLVGEGRILDGDIDHAFAKSPSSAEREKIQRQRLGKYFRQRHAPVCCLERYRSATLIGVELAADTVKSGKCVVNSGFGSGWAA